MKRVVLIAAAAAFFAGAAMAADPSASLVGNTLTVTGPEGTSKLWYKADKTFTGVDEKGQKMGGTWEIVGEKICSTVKTPDVRAPHCGKLKADLKVGDSWNDTRGNGDKVTVSLTAGS